MLSGPSRIGKTELLKTILFAVSVRLRPEDPRLAVVGTLDKCRDISGDLVAGCALMLDEADPGDAQIIHSRATIWKSFLQTAQKSDVRGRQQDSSIAAFVVRGMTVANSIRSADTFAGRITCFEADKVALANRLAWCDVETRLWENDRHIGAVARGPAVVLSTEDARVAFDSMLA